jgi:predicted GNAT family acetyltransferase
VVDVASVLTASELKPPREVDGEVRALESEADWESRARLSFAIEERDDEETHLRFARGRNVQEQSLVADGRGTRFGVLVDGEVVSTAAVFTTEPGVARFQSVETHPGHRRKGLAAAAVHAAGRHALEHLGARTLVIVADDDGEAIGIYRRLGFADTERQLMLERRHGDRASLAG